MKYVFAFVQPSSEKEANRIEDEMGLYTPILKGFLTECSQEAAYYGQQVLFAPHLLTHRNSFPTPPPGGVPPAPSASNLGVETHILHSSQVYGGHGYIKEWGMEQIARDARISTLYEGTTGVQALDLLGRRDGATRKGRKEG
jgi:alkylation response protein AidB-like acyl-CoA dehydrogenase